MDDPDGLVAVHRDEAAHRLAAAGEPREGDAVHLWRHACAVEFEITLPQRLPLRAVGRSERANDHRDTAGDARDSSETASAMFLGVAHTSAPGDRTQNLMWQGAAAKLGGARLRQGARRMWMRRMRRGLGERKSGEAQGERNRDGKDTHVRIL